MKVLFNQKKKFSRAFLRLGALGISALLVCGPLGPAFAASSSHKKKTETPASTSKEGQSEESASPADSYPSLLIGPGDELEIYVVNFSSGNGYSSNVAGEAGAKSQLPTDYMVDSDGMILFPFLGKIQLKGMTQINAAELLRLKLKEYVNNPQVTVLVRSSNYYNVSVLGDVARPGKFLIRGEPTVFSLLAEAGGAMPDANLGGSLIIHGDTYKKEGINLDHYLKDKGSQDKPPVLYPGDVLMVPKAEGLTANDWAIIASIVASGAIIATQIK
jgi:polysaccharide export outer membrane protein